MDLFHDSPLFAHVCYRLCFFNYKYRVVGNLAIAPSMASLSKRCSMMYGLPDMENNLALALLTIPACPIYLNLSLSTLQSITWVVAVVRPQSCLCLLLAIQVIPSQLLSLLSYYALL